MRSIVAMTFTWPDGSTRTQADGEPITIDAAASMIAPFCLTPYIYTNATVSTSNNGSTSSANSVLPSAQAKNRLPTSVEYLLATTWSLTLCA